jgi:hypothetical protein
MCPLFHLSPQRRAMMRHKDERKRDSAEPFSPQSPAAHRDGPFVIWSASLIISGPSGTF